MSTISTFIKYSEYQGDKTLLEIVEIIQSDKYKVQIEEIRSAIANDDLKQADSLKKKLPAFTTSGTFHNGRKANLLTSYSGFIILDIDKLALSQLQDVKNKAALAPYSWAVFVSPGGRGIKIIVPVNSNAEHHQTAMLQVSSYYEQALEITLDSSGKDASRLCFFSHDPELYHNPSAATYQVIIQEKIPVSKPEPVTGSNHSKNWSEILEKCIDFTNKVNTYTEGNRNNYIHLLACNSNRYGIPQIDALELIKSRYDLAPSEIEASVKSAYQNNTQEFAKYTKSANLTNLQSIDDNELTKDYLLETPIIPQSIYDTLPDILKTTADSFSNDLRKRDVYLTSAIVVLSGCLPNVSGLYQQDTVYPNLFSFVIAPAASGKGVLKNAKSLGDKIHNRLLSENEKAIEKYHSELLNYKRLERNYKGEGDPPKKPQKPPFKLLFIPGDSSQAKILEFLRDSDGKGIICETEADTVSGANKQDWGNYSPILRGGFHHEKISVARKTDNLYIEIPEPCLSVALAGTPNQVSRLIASAEDGLFSRFIFYAFRTEIKWQSPAPNPNKKSLKEVFESASQNIIDTHDFLLQSKLQMTLSDSQWNKLNQSFEGKLNNVALFTGEDALSVVFRLGLIAFRFCMIFTALRKFRNGDLSETIECEDQDFENALILSDIYLQHSLLIFNNLVGDEKKLEYNIPDNKQRFFEALPNTTFQRKEAVEIGKNFQMSARSVDSFLRASVPNVLTLIKTGFYQKKTC